MSHVCLSKILPTEFQRAPRTAMKRKGETKSHAFGAAKLGEKRTKRTRWKKKRFSQPLGGVAFENLAGLRKEGSLRPIITTVEQTVKLCPDAGSLSTRVVVWLAKEKRPRKQRTAWFKWTSTLHRSCAAKIFPAHLSLSPPRYR